MSDSLSVPNVNRDSSPSRPPPPPPPQLQPGPKYSNRAASALARFAQPFFTGSRPPSPHTTYRPDPGGPRFSRTPSLPGASQTVTHKTGIPISALDISPQRTHAVIGGKEILKTIRVSPDRSSEEFNIRNAVISYSSTHHPTGGVSSRLKEQLSVRDVKWSHGEFDRIIATAVANGRIIIYDLYRAGLELSRFQGHSRQVHRLAFNPHYPAWLLSGSQDATIRMWDLRMAAAERGVSTCFSKEQYISNSDAVRDIRWSPSDGVMFAAATDSGTIQLWDQRKTNAPLMRIAAHDKPCYAVDWHPDGKHLVSGGTDKQVKVWDFSSSAERRQKPTFQFRTPQAILSVRWRPACLVAEPDTLGDWQSTQVVTSYDREDPRIHLWDLRRPHIPFREFDRYDSAATDLLWHSKDLLWTVGDTGIFTQTDIRHAPQVINQRPMCSIAWSPTGEVLLFSQGRPKRRAFGFSASDFLGTQEEESNGDEMLLSRSPDELDEAILTSSLRPRHNKGSSARPSKSLGSTPPSNEDMHFVLSLEKALAKSKPSVSCQLGAFGSIFQTIMNTAVFRYLANHYSPTMEYFFRESGQSGRLALLLESLKSNADLADDVGMYKLAQTWRLVRYSILQELQCILNTQRKLQDKGNARLKKESAKSETLSGKPRLADEGRHEKVKSRLFKGVMETERRKSLIADVESTSNMTTPLAQPLPDSPVESQESSYSQFMPFDDEMQPLPPSVLSLKYGTLNSNEIGATGFDPSLSGHPIHRQLECSEDTYLSEDAALHRTGEGVAQEYQNEQKSAPRAIFGRADWHFRSRQEFPKSTSDDDYDQKMEDKRAAIRDYRAGPKKVLSLESPVDLKTQPISGTYLRRESSESFQMFSESTDSSHPAKSFGASFSPGSRELEGPNGENYIPEIPKGGPNFSHLEADATSPVRSESAHDTGYEPRASYIPQPASARTKIDLERPSSPPPLVTETMAIEDESVISSGDVAYAALDVDPLLFPGLSDDLSSISIPVSRMCSDSKPWSADVILREAIRHYLSNAPVDYQSAAYFLDKLHLFFGDCNFILPYEEREFILKAYNENLLRLKMFIEAAERRLLCVPSYPAVYEYAQVDSFINVFCVTCKRPFDNPRRDNCRCHRCNTSQQPCPICMSLDPPTDWVLDHIGSAGDTILEESGGNSLSNDSPLSSKTELFTSFELRRLGLNSEPLDTVPRPMGAALWSWCQGCGHGGHVACMVKWLSDVGTSEGGCATPDCFHDCAPGPRRDENRAELLEESKRHDSSATRRAAGVGFVKRDAWTRSESKAVEKVRGMLAGAVSAGETGLPATAASTGPVASSSGVMSPKKVRLVTPSEQGQRHPGPSTVLQPTAVIAGREAHLKT